MTRQQSIGALPRRRQPNQNLLAGLRIGMICVGAAILFFTLLLVILPMFRVKDIRVSGNEFYSAEEIKAASGIQMGSELFALDMDAAINGILEHCAYVDTITIKWKSLSAIEIVVKEKVNTMYTVFNDTYIAFDTNFKVLSQSDSPEPYAHLLYVELPSIQSLSVGGKIHFANEESDMSYVTTLLDALCERGLLSRISSVDFSKKYSTSYVLDGSCRVELGRVGQLNLKFDLVDQILADRKFSDSYAQIDVSSTQKPTYRALAESEF